MKTLFSIFILFILSDETSLAQSRLENVLLDSNFKIVASTINKSKTELLLKIKKGETSKTIYFNINKDKVIKAFDYKTKNDIEYALNSNHEIYYVLHRFRDTNFTHKDWKPNKYYKTYYKEHQEDSGWHFDKSVTLSTLRIYTAKNDKLLYNINIDTGFFYSDYSKKITHTPFKTIGTLKFPYYIGNAWFYANSDSFLIINKCCNEYYGDQSDYNFIFNVYTKKKVKGYIYDNIELSKNRKYFFRKIQYNKTSRKLEELTNTTYLKYQIDLFSTKDFKEKKYLPKLNVTEVEELIQDQEYITDSLGNDYIVSSLGRKNLVTKSEFFEYFLVHDLNGKLLWQFNKINYQNLRYQHISGTTLIYYFYQIEKSYYIEIVDFKTKKTEKLEVIEDNFYHPLSLIRIPKIFLEKNKKIIFFNTIMPFVYNKESKQKVLLFDNSFLEKVVCLNRNNSLNIDFQQNGSEIEYYVSICNTFLPFNDTLSYQYILGSYNYQNDSIKNKLSTLKEIMYQISRKKVYSKNNVFEFTIQRDSTFQVKNVLKNKVVLQKKFDYIPFLNSSFYFTPDNKKLLFLDETEESLEAIYFIETNKLIYLKDVK